VGAPAGFVELLPPVAAMVARSADELPADDGDGRWSFEPKMDGFRCLAFRTGDERVLLQSRQQRSLTRYFPEVVAALHDRVPAGTVLDGVIWGRKRPVQHVADRPRSIRRISLWTAYLRPVYDGVGRSEPVTDLEQRAPPARPVLSPSCAAAGEPAT
jgi:ATP-dependent DNA ligase